MTFEEKVSALNSATCVMNSSKLLCIADATRLLNVDENPAMAMQRLEKAASYQWGFNRPIGWHDHARFQITGCSSCGEDFGPGDCGYSHCSDHRHQLQLS